jgi:hypothetical protein
MRCSLRDQMASASRLQRSTTGANARHRRSKANRTDGTAWSIRDGRLLYRPRRERSAFEDEPGRRAGQAAHRDEARRIAANIAKLVEAVLTSALYPAPDTLRPTQVSDLLLMTLINPLPFARLMTIGLYPHIAAYRLSGHTAAASSVGWPVPSAWHGTALYSGRVGRHQCAYGEGACSQAGDHRFGQHGSSADPSIVLENGPSFALVNRTRRLLHRPRGGHAR